MKKLILANAIWYLVLAVVMVSAVGCAKKTLKKPLLEPVVVEAPKIAPKPEAPAAAPVVAPAPIPNIMIYFEFNSDGIRRDAAIDLDEYSKLLQGRDVSFRYIGSACQIGTEEYNMDLSRRRAENARAYLGKGGTVLALGESRPATTIESEYWRNRTCAIEVVEE